ncbi:phenylalanine--tRNA ligase subunit beta [Gloeocapsa sp. PCC 73106]|uniref:phenylalanine--tRNA ligase subunit beta n=1 Tax=Gloeocapsa sp. PCC 73106 TaxID=102232 RepID=UPI0002AC845F|nr:phenylalanine--tRNA ligase subunit beta [Gloeocapsa sp. PCC 73106]ELR97787.1 phenylalanyl-tRNA synthetase, beta subunit [Gloeocapsa sp. PCC 73106]
MKISLNWLQELVNVKLAAEELAQILTMAGFEVEAIEDLRQQAQGVVIGRVVDRQPHPNADKLSVCQVDIGQNTTANIVCGAPNVRADIFVPVATLGTYLPAVDLKLAPVKLRGVPSEGMICSLAELGLAKESEGIYIFPEDNLVPGTDVRPLLGLDDVILDLTTTANRADALSLVGIAREVGALTGAPVQLSRVELLTFPETSDLKTTISDSHACPVYMGTKIQGVKVGPSPDWLKWRLQNAGIRSINNIVDATNYILLEWGQPLHAFDAEKLKVTAQSEDLNMGVRFAVADESLQTLDGQKRQLKPQNLLITANDVPVAIAGVMGGEDTEVDEHTVNLVLEGAIFDPVTIRRSARSQSLRTEASTRYERGINQAEFSLALARAIALITELAGGQVTAQSTGGGLTQSRRIIHLRYERLEQVLGPVQTGRISHTEVEDILKALGCELQSVGDGLWEVTIPPYRQRDLEREIDLIEEVARLYGYDRFCAELPSKTQPGYLSTSEAIKRQLRYLLRAVGLTEVVHYSLVSNTGKEVVLNNPLFKEYSALRTNLTTGLIEACAYNLSQGNGVLNASEIGRVFSPTSGEISEREMVAGILGGDRTFAGRWVVGGKSVPLTWYEAKGLLESVFQSLNLSVEYRVLDSDPRLHPGRTASLWLNGQELGFFGQLHPQLTAAKDLPAAVYVFELDFTLLLNALTQIESLTAKFKLYSTYPAVARDLAFFSPVDISVAQLTTIMNEAGGNLLEDVEVFDQYQGENVPTGQRSLAFSLVYRASDRTLTESEIEPVHQQIREALVNTFNVTLRS